MSKLDIKFERLTPFKRCVLQNFPFIEEDFDALTNYGLLCKVVAYLNKVIASQNEVQGVTEEIVTAFNNLYEYVKNYFDNLDVQEEINNKLDEMTEDGTLQEIIGDYLNANAVWGFDTVADMKASTNLINGSFARTLGYYAKNDGGAGLYKIRTVTNQDVEDNGSIIPMDDNTLVAELIFDEVTTPEQFGAYGDGTHDDTTALQNALDKAKKVYLKGIYKVSSTININCSIDMDGDSYIKAADTLITEVVHIASTHQVGNTYNVNVDASGVAALGIGVGSPRKSILNLNVINAGTVGISAATAGVYGNSGNEFKCIVVGNSSGTTTTGILINNFDSTFSTIVTQDCLHGVEINGGELIADCVHAWISNELASTLWANSAAVYFAGAYTAIINWLYQDSVKYGIKSNGGYGSVKYFEYNNTLTDAATLYNDYKNVSNSTKSLRLTIDRFKNDFEEKQQLLYEGLTNASKFGVTLQNGVPSDQASIQNYPTFTDCDDAPQFGGFYCKYDVTNLPQSVGGFLECKVVGNMAIQNFYRHDFASVKRVYYRCRTLGADTWSDWFFLEPAA